MRPHDVSAYVAMRESKGMTDCFSTRCDPSSRATTAATVEQIESLQELGFIKRRENVILLGPPGVGKTPRRLRADPRRGNRAIPLETWSR